MSNQPAVPVERREQTIEAVALFAALMHARESNDYHEAARAHKELERLGVKVRIPRRQRVVEGVRRA